MTSGGITVLDTKTSEIWMRTPYENLFLGINEKPENIYIEKVDSFDSNNEEEKNSKSELSGEKSSTWNRLNELQRKKLEDRINEHLGIRESNGLP